MKNYKTKFTLNQLNKLYGDLMLCCDCGTYTNQSKMFIRQYQNTAICLCKTCAEKLRNEIEEQYKENISKES